MGESSFRKIKKILEKPVPPPHIRQRQYQVVIPWYQSLWNTIRPPSASPERRKPMNSTQRRMIWAVIAILVPSLIGLKAYDYWASAPQRAQAAYDAGMSRVGPGDYKGAYERFSDSISIWATPQAYLQRGFASQELGNGAAALEDWTKALEIDPNFAEALTARGTYYRLNGRNTEALSDLERSLKVAPSVDAYFQRGQIRDAMGEHQAAIEDYDKAIELRREAPYIYLARSVAKRAVGDAAGYEADQQTAFRLQH